MKVSVVIPVYNESASIGATLASIACQPGPLEILVVDGRSSDDTLARAAVHATVLEAPRGRASQMNAGWRAASGDVLLFVHSDTLLPKDALVQIRRVLTNRAVESGTFRMRFDRNHWLLRLFAWCANRNLPSLCFGDRSVFVRASTMREVGGFADIPIFEDLHLVRQLHRRGSFRFLRPVVTTASRRLLQNGILRQQLLNATLWILYRLGAPPARLTRRYPYS